MRSTAGFTLAAAISVAAIRVAMGPGAGALQEGAAAMQPAVKQQDEMPLLSSGYSGGCTAFDAAAAGGAGSKKAGSGEGAKDAGVKDANRGAAAAVLERFLGRGKPPGPEMHYAIALAPDPVHTNLSLIFDREMVTFQQAAQDEGFTYDSSWLPWQDERSFSGLSDREREAEQTDRREACPGVLLFRHSVSDKARPGEEPAGVGADVPPDPFARGLIVFVVGEQPTGGVNHDQWSNAMHWLAGHAVASVAGAGPADRVLRVMGPTFSGSLVSLERELAGIYAVKSAEGTDKAKLLDKGKLPDQDKMLDKDKLRERFPTAMVLSGSVRGCSSIRWFQQRLEDKRFGFESQRASLGRVSFGSFQENDAVQIDRFLRYMSMQGMPGRDTAILAEDETAYANPYFPATKPGTSDVAKSADQPASCEFAYGEENRPLRLSYPRDISALRKAYEKQSIFVSGGAGGRNAHPILQSSDDVATNGSTDMTDTIPTYSGKLTPVVQEAVLYGVVSYLRTHHTRYLMLRCSNPLDFLFLTRFFHRAYPEGRIVTVGADILFRREIDSTEFRGVMSLSTYPLLPRDQHWTALLGADSNGAAGAMRAILHTHRVFEDQSQQGQYIASRYLLGGECRSRAVLPVDCEVKPGVPGVADPFWLETGGVPREGSSAPTWLSVVGRDGYWPVAVLNDETVKQDDEGKEVRLADGEKEPRTPLSTIVKLHAGKGLHYDLDGTYLALKALRGERVGGDRAIFNASVLLHPSLSWKIVTALAMFLLTYQGIGLHFGSRQAATRLLAGFRVIASRSQDFLVALNSVFAVLLLLAPLSVLVCLYGTTWLAPDGYSVWCGVGFAMLAIVALAAMMVLRRMDGRHKWATLVYYLAALAGMVAVAVSTLLLSCNEANRFPIALRILHPTSGVSPLVPVVLLFGGFYLWSWQALAGNMLLSAGLPILPRLRGEQSDLGWRARYRRWFRLDEIERDEVAGRRVWRFRMWLKRQLGVKAAQVETAAWRLRDGQYRISHEMGRRILHVAAPFSLPIAVVVPASALCLCAVLYFHSDLPLLTMEGMAFTVWINLALLASLLLTTAEACRLSGTWRELHRLLNALNQTRLRRTFARLKAIDTHSLWAVSGNAWRIQSLFFAHQIDAANRLSMLAGGRGQAGGYWLPGLCKNTRLVKLRVAVETGRRFARMNAGQIESGSRWDEPVRAFATRERILLRDLFADAVGETLNTVLLPAWREETDSLSIDEKCAVGGAETEESKPVCMELSKDETVRAAEEFVCFHYIAFIQNIMARMRTMTLSMAVLFVAVCFAISFYPFVPRTEIGMWMIANLAVIAASVIFVYVAMERDATLSYIANTRPGHLSSAFWIKSAAFLVGPVIGILTTQFPAIADSVLAWVQPGLDAISK